MSDRPAISIDIGTLAFEGLGRAFSQRAAASFERALAAEVAACSATTRWSHSPGVISVPDPGRQSPEVFGRRLARQVVRALAR